VNHKKIRRKKKEAGVSIVGLQVTEEGESKAFVQASRGGHLKRNVAQPPKENKVKGREGKNSCGIEDARSKDAREREKCGQKGFRTGALDKFNHLQGIAGLEGKAGHS